MNMPAHPMPSNTPPANTSGSVAVCTYMAAIRQADPANTNSALSDTSITRAPRGK